MATGRVPEPVLLCPDDVIRDALLFLRHEVASQDVVASHFPAINQKVVLGDRTQLQQVIVNLASTPYRPWRRPAARSVTLSSVRLGKIPPHCTVRSKTVGQASRLATSPACLTAFSRPKTTVLQPTMNPHRAARDFISHCLSPRRALRLCDACAPAGRRAKCPLSRQQALPQERSATARTIACVVQISST